MICVKLEKCHAGFPPGLSSACCFLDTKWTVKVTDWEYAVVAGSLKRKSKKKKIHVKNCSVDALDDSDLPGARGPGGGRGFVFRRFWQMRFQRVTKLTPLANTLRLHQRTRVNNGVKCWQRVLQNVLIKAYIFVASAAIVICRTYTNSISLSSLMSLCLTLNVSCYILSHNRELNL